MERERAASAAQAPPLARKLVLAENDGEGLMRSKYFVKGVQPLEVQTITRHVSTAQAVK